MCDLTNCDQNRSGERVAATGKQQSKQQQRQQQRHCSRRSYAGRFRRTCQEVVDRKGGAADNWSKMVLRPLTAAPLSMLSDVASEADVSEKEEKKRRSARPRKYAEP